MLSRVFCTIREHQLLPRGERVLVAVSGGPDSMALLHALVHLAPRLGISVEAVTVDHGLRPESAGEAAEVVERCAKLGVPGQVLRVDVAAERRPHVSLQDAARRARLAGLIARAQQRGCARIALGHTADDQAETILFRIVRGTGVAGLMGIPYRRDALVRPLLDIRRAQVLAFLRRRQVAFFTDPSNQDPRFARSRIRHQWLPSLARENPRVVEALLALGQSARDRIGRPGGAPAHGADAIIAGPGAPTLGRKAALVLRRLVEQGQGSHEVAVPGGIVEVTYGRPVFRARGTTGPSGTDTAVAPGSGAQMPVPGPGSYRWPPSSTAPQVDLEVAFREGDQGPPRAAVTFDAEIFARGLWLRAPRPGDRMRPRGGRGSRKLQDLLVDAKIPRKQRAGLPVLITASGIILHVPGLRPSEEARPAPEARRWVEIRVR